MNDNDNRPAHGHESPSGGTAVSLEHGHVAGSGNVPDRFENPGLPPHQPRHADVDPKAAKRAERQVLALFTLSILGTLGFVIAYFAIDIEAMTFFPFFGHVSVLHVLLGVTMALSLLGIGLGAVHWAKTLMPDHESIEERHPIHAAPADREGFVDTLADGGEKAQLGRRPMIGVLGGTALGLFAVPPLLQVLGGLGPVPGSQLAETFWKGGMRLVRDPEMTPIRADEVTLGSVFHVLPEGIDGETVHGRPDSETRNDEDLGVLERKAKAVVLLMRLDPSQFQSQKARDWGYQGIVAYNKICTHAGCPVGLYEQQTHHLLCPCHQSTFDVTQDCKVIFGPAKRPLPQLKITVDDEGYLVSTQGFMEPVGPSYWERS
ncbi:cytochrome bc1 complex Rieske iron-sulfur subunit [Agilicoccus flavus]|uniref:cytochrome bc1 complex Rieske iron-sulfur subunit n=1 Tax=Agilicoccus flavus TaxID=2775968 RepID=UPI001CF6C2C4|nr:Rieske 2Fe-2S domain-containing protein [Agilicoccus flavus]